MNQEETAAVGGNEPQSEMCDPRGACWSCKFLVNDWKEVVSEMTRRGGGVIKSVERERNEQGVEIGEGVKPVLIAFKQMSDAIRERTGVPANRIGLCELGLYDFVDGRAVPKEPRPCPKWQERSDRLVRIRPYNWRQLREWALDQRITPGQTLERNEACPCGSGRKFKVCCLERTGIK
jgi:hypothetical protein